MSHTTRRGAAHELTVRALTKEFGTGPSGRGAVLDGVDLTARPGTLTLIVGGPLTGKTTLARCLTGTYRPDGGRIGYRLGGEQVDLATAPARTVAWLRGRHIARFDEPVAAPPTVPAVTAVTRAAGCDRPSAIRTLRQLQAVDVTTCAVGRLRSRDRDAVALAAALAARRPFVVLDQPERSCPAGILAAELERIVAAGAAVVVTAAPRTELTSIATEVGELREGRLTWHTP